MTRRLDLRQRVTILHPALHKKLYCFTSCNACSSLLPKFGDHGRFVAICLLLLGAQCSRKGGLKNLSLSSRELLGPQDRMMSRSEHIKTRPRREIRSGSELRNVMKHPEPVVQRKRAP